MERSRGTRVAFRIVTGLFLSFLLVFFYQNLLAVVILWLPDKVAAPIMETTTSQMIHRIHEMVINVMVWALVIGVAVQLRKPDRKVAPMLLALSVPVILDMIQIVLGEFSISDMDGGPILIPVIAMALLHPRARELVRGPTFDRRMLGLAGFAAIPWLVFAAGAIRLQWTAAPGDPHAAMGHWAYFATFSILMVVWSLIGASDHSGWRVPAWIAGIAAINYGLVSLVYAGLASAASTGWAIAAVIYGVAYLTLTVQRARAAKQSLAEAIPTTQMSSIDADGSIGGLT